MTTRQKDVMHILFENDIATYNGIREKNGITSNSTIKKFLNNLNQLVVIERDGTFGSKWIIKFDEIK